MLPLAILGLSGGAVAGTQIRKFDCELVLNVASLFPENATIDTISDDYFKGNYSNEVNKRQVSKVLALRGKPVKVRSTLFEKTDGGGYSLELPGVSLPSQLPEIRHEVYDGKQNVKWTTYEAKLVDVGYVDKGTSESLKWSPVVKTLLGYLPVGPEVKKPGLSENESAYWETPIIRVDEANLKLPKRSERYYVIRYTGPARKKIDTISMYWNPRAVIPFEVLKFNDAEIVGNRLQYGSVLLARYDNDKIASELQFKLLSQTEESEEIQDVPPKDLLFLDRRLGAGKHKSFIYDGKAIPTEDDLARDWRERENLVKSRQRDNRPIFQFAGGSVLICLGFYLWRKSKAIR